MPALLNILGLLAFVTGAALLGYDLYLVVAGILGFNPGSAVRPSAGLNTVLAIGLAALLLLALGWLLARASVRAEWRRQNAAVAAGP